MGATLPEMDRASDTLEEAVKDMWAERSQNGMPERMQPNPLPKILVVDDIRENVALMRQLLEPKGYRIEEAFDGEEALAKVETENPDVVLLDLLMPGMNGFEVCQRAKRNLLTRHIPIIVVTGLAEHDANIRALEAGADDFLTRPIDPVLLEARIRGSVRSKALQDQVIRYQARLEQENVQLEEGVRSRTTQLERAQHVTVYSLARLAESRDPETGEHLERMRRYVRELAVEMGTWEAYGDQIDSRFVEQLYYSSPLHDIGKVGVPDDILLKPGKLSCEEFDIMKTHTLIGGDTLQAADVESGHNSFLTMGCRIAYAHHERWDGSGYPNGLVGDEIPLEAQIVALGDAYDAMTSKRPYKEPFSHAKTRALILEGNGKHFAPDVVDAFLKREKKFIKIKDEYRDAEHPTQIQQVMNKLEEIRALANRGNGTEK